MAFRTRVAPMATVAVVWLVAAPPASAVSVDETLTESQRVNAEASESQQRIDALSDETDRMVAEYRAALKDSESLRHYNEQVEDLIAAQQREMDSLRRQIDSVTVIGREILPLMERMLDTLEKFVGLDVPFLKDERGDRIARLREMMGRADVTISEKYRRVLEAYQIENEYGRTIEAYRGPLASGGGERVVDFLRVGRVALLYQTLDGDEAGVWDHQNQRWTVLGGEYRGSIREGLRMARKQVAPDLIAIPVQAPEAIQ